MFGTRVDMNLCAGLVLSVPALKASGLVSEVVRPELAAWHSPTQARRPLLSTVALAGVSESMRSAIEVAKY